MYLKDLVTRYEHNPILTCADLKGSDAVFNAGACKYNGKYYLLVSTCRPGAPGNGKGSFSIREPRFGIVKKSDLPVRRSKQNTAG